MYTTVSGIHVCLGWGWRDWLVHLLITRFFEVLNRCIRKFWDISQQFGFLKLYTADFLLLLLFRNHFTMKHLWPCDSWLQPVPSHCHHLTCFMLYENFSFFSWTPLSFINIIQPINGFFCPKSPAHELCWVLS